MQENSTLSKSQYLKGYQCPLALWYSINRTDLKPAINASLQAKFDAGNEVGEFSRKYFPDGIQIKTLDMLVAINRTNEAIKTSAKAIYEAAATNARTGTQARIDILKKVEGTDKWDLIEVKSSTSVKDEHVLDMAFQYLVFTGAGYKINSCQLMHINNKYVRNGKVDPKQLFVLEDITDRVMAEQDQTTEIADRLFPILETKKEPAITIGRHCASPYDCDFKQYCWRDVPEYSVFDVFTGDKAEQMAQRISSYKVEDIPDASLPTGVKAIDIDSYKQNKVHIDKPKIQSFLNELQYPLYYFDYETITGAVPFFDGIRPYQQVPFQFSLHVQDAPGSEPRHFEFIHKENTDPRQQLADALISLCGSSGSVVCYNATFEKGCNKDLALHMPHVADQILAINDRMVDLLVPFKSRALYHPQQMGSASIKAVLPSFTTLQYDGLNIGNGEQAIEAYTRFLKGQLSDEEQGQLWADLSAYCKLDTYAMVELVRILYGFK